ncbi:hypothetical protein AB0230_01865 [Microbacterium sp. NPDC089190]|uniref:VG15 protein n=1 Tax=Microbacterium sp. NPDC089190 TaxID=3155063 RepID=UPI00344CB4B6
MTAYGDTAAVLAADFYDSARQVPGSASGAVTTVFAQPAKTKQSEGVIRWAVEALVGETRDWEGFQSRVLGAAQRLLLQPARQTVDSLAQVDARSGKVAAVSWSRKLSPERAKSGKSCNFCKMLAGRGPVYRSASAAGAVIGRGVDPSIALDESGNRRAGYVGGVGGGTKTRGVAELASDYHDNCHCVPVPTFYTRETREFSVRGYPRTESVLVPIS